MNCKLTDFSDYSDLTSYINCRDNQGGTPQHCLSVGDNGTGASGKITAQDHTPMVALPSADIRAKWGSTTSAWGKMVNVTYGGKTIKAELADISPTGVCDLNPAALAALGQKHPFSDQGSWEWADVPTPPAPPPVPKTTQFYAIYSESSSITFADVQQIAAACHAQASGELRSTWGKRVAVEAVESASEVPLGHFKVIIKDDIGDGALGYHTDEHGQPVCYIKAGTVDDTCVTCSHEILEASVDSFGNRFIVCDIAPYGKVRVLVEIADPPESYAYADHGLPVSDYLLPEWYDEVTTPGMVYSYKGHIKTPQTLLPGGYFSFMTPDGKWWQRQFFGDAQQDDGPFAWSRQGNESMREMVDRETRTRRQSAS
jgi:hypothetical protein